MENLHTKQPQVLISHQNQYPTLLLLITNFKAYQKGRLYYE